MEQQVHLDQEQMLSFIRELPPFFLPETATISQGGSITTTTRLEEKHAKGHFSGLSVVPLIRMCEVGAQSGLVLAAYVFHEADSKRRDRYVPLAVGCGASEATTDDVVTMPCVLTVNGILTKQDGKNRFEVDLTFFADMGSGQVKVGYLNAVKYAIVPARGKFRAVN